MRILSVFLTACLFLPPLFAAQISSKSGLVVIIDQKHLSGISEGNAAPLSPPALRVLLPLLGGTKTLGTLGEVINLFLKEDMGSNKDGMIQALNNSRETWVRQQAGHSRNLYIVTGKNAEDQAYMEDVYKKAIEQNRVVDVISIVGEDGELVGIPDDMSKVRLFYTSACNGKKNVEHFTNRGVFAHVGHEAVSASPLFTYAILKNWLSGEGLEISLQNAWNEGKKILNLFQVQLLVKMLGGYESGTENILTNSMIYLTIKGEPEVSATIFIDSPLPTDSAEHQLRIIY